MNRMLRLALATIIAAVSVAVALRSLFIASYLAVQSVQGSGPAHVPFLFIGVVFSLVVFMLGVLGIRLSLGLARRRSH